jgi:hypothetical protein
MRLQVAPREASSKNKLDSSFKFTLEMEKLLQSLFADAPLVARGTPLYGEAVAS